jgi:hypothetical protein
MSDCIEWPHTSQEMARMYYELKKLFYYELKLFCGRIFLIDAFDQRYPRIRGRYR